MGISGTGVSPVFIRSTPVNSSDPQWINMLATVLGTLGVWLLLPRGRAGGKAAGAVFTAVALGLFASRLPWLRSSPDDSIPLVENAVFFVLAGITVVAAIATVTLRKPVYCAIWFAVSLLGTAGLFLFIGAQFLAVATVLVYAGAILVTFLFVLMLTQPEGRTQYDRVSWEALVSAATGMAVVGILSMTVARVLTATYVDLTADGREVARPAVAAAAEAAGDRAGGVLAEQHVAHLGAELFGRHLIAVEVTGTLLLAALVAAAVIVAKERSEREE